MGVPTVTPQTFSAYWANRSGLSIITYRAQAGHMVVRVSPWMAS